MRPRAPWLPALQRAAGQCLTVIWCGRGRPAEPALLGLLTLGQLCRGCSTSGIFLAWVRVALIPAGWCLRWVRIQGKDGMRERQRQLVLRAVRSRPQLQLGSHLHQVFSRGEGSPVPPLPSCVGCRRRCRSFRSVCGPGRCGGKAAASARVGCWKGWLAGGCALG